MVFINNITSGGYGATHTAEWPFPAAEQTVLWFAIGWKANNPQTLHVQPRCNDE